MNKLIKYLFLTGFFLFSQFSFASFTISCEDFNFHNVEKYFEDEGIDIQITTTGNGQCTVHKVINNKNNEEELLKIKKLLGSKNLTLRDIHNILNYIIWRIEIIEEPPDILITDYDVTLKDDNNNKKEED